MQDVFVVQEFNCKNRTSAVKFNFIFLSFLFFYFFSIAVWMVFSCLAFFSSAISCRRSILDDFFPLKFPLSFHSFFIFMFVCVRDGQCVIGI